MAAPRLPIASESSAIFVNRDKPLQLIDEAIRETPIDGIRLLVFHGVGGQGKTALCRQVFRQVSEGQDSRYPQIKAAEIDLRGRDKSDPVNLLIWIRNGFAKAQVSCPAFDLALAIMWEATRPEQPFPKLTNAWLAKSSELMTEAAPDVITSLRETVEKSVETLPLLGPLITRGSIWVIDKSKKAWLHSKRPYLAHLYTPNGEVKKSYELETLLPWMLAQDLNHHLSENPTNRFLLLMDEYERVFDQGGAGKHWEENPFDATVRRFVAETNGLAAVFFSREPLPWENEADWRDDLEGRQYPLSGLIEFDARRWLEKAGIDSTDIQDAMIEGAREAPYPDRPIYPLLLELQLEHWRHLIASGITVSKDEFSVSSDSLSGRCQELVRRVLRDYGAELQMVIERLSVSLRFDRAAFKHVIEGFGIGLSVDAFDQVAKLSLFSLTDDGFVSMHRAVADIIVQMMEPNYKRTSIETLLDHYQVRLKAPNIKELTQDHILALFEAAYLRSELDAEGYINWLNENTQQLSQAARANSGERLWRSGLGFSLKNSGEEHPDTASSYNNVAYNLNAQGRYEEAEPLYHKGLEIRQRVLGEEHPSTASSYNNVASNLDHQGRYEEAEPLYRKGLKIRQRVLGEEHPDTASSYNNVASNLNAQGRYEKAEPLYHKGLEIRQRVLGEEHPSTASSYNNVAYNLDAQGRYEEAEPLFRKAVQLIETTLGSDHPSSRAMRNNLNHTLKKIGN